MRNRLLVGAAMLALLATGCGGYDETTVPAPPPPAEATPGPPPTCSNDDGTQVRSYEPRGEIGRGPGSRPGSATKGRIVAGVAADTFLLGSRNPASGKIEGFDIDMVDAIAASIFGTAVGHVELKVITAAERIPKLQSGEIDIVARNMTVNCSRWQQIAFSQIYYDAGQKVLVGKDAGIEGVKDLDGKRICAPAGTTSIENIQKFAPKAIPVTAGDNAECMVLFQNGEADGVSTDDTVLAGLAAQDPYAVVLDTEFLTQEPYGIGVNSDDVDLVQLINATLEDMRDDGRWQRSYEKWLRAPLQVPGSQPQPRYGR